MANSVPPNNAGSVALGATCLPFAEWKDEILLISFAGHFIWGGVFVSAGSLAEKHEA